MLYSKTTDNYYSSPDDAEDDLEDDQTLNDLQLVICKPNYICLESDYFDRVAPEEEGLPEEVLKAIDVFNESVRNVIVSWSPGEVALLIK